MLAVVVRGLSKHQSAFLFDCCVVIVRFALLSCYSSAKTRIRPVKSYQIEQIKEYQVFKDFGKAVYDMNNISNAPKGHQKIRVHFVFDVKHCGKLKARLVADGHLTKEPMETVYSGVVSIRNLRLTMFLAELNNLELWGADVGNAYLQALTREKLYIVGGPELKNYKDMFLSCTKHFMVQDQEEHVGMINSLTYSITWVSSLQEQTQTYG